MYDSQDYQMVVLWARVREREKQILVLLEGVPVLVINRVFKTVRLYFQKGTRSLAMMAMNRASEEYRLGIVVTKASKGRLCVTYNTNVSHVFSEQIVISPNALEV